MFALTVRRKLYHISTEAKTVKYADTFLLQCCFVLLLKFGTELLLHATFQRDMLHSGVHRIHLIYVLRFVLKPSQNTATLNAA